ncbi:serine/threonine protein kinase [Trichococcus flocculiformis]|uniref:protein kinase family protein n=1 Tax=Trichococcus TaxID=82802 RepID=UPI0007A87BA2|nr:MULTISPECIES: protein kinase family protein [Trichococcus]CZR09550.1 Hypothetical protein TES5_2713 [Trichococcus sp. ES5]SHG12250.1 serine/threonine protein kinase [Trichococcus flocculiformis]
MHYFNEIKYRGKRFREYTVEEIAGEGRYGLCFHAKNDFGRRVIIKKFKNTILTKNSKNNIHEAVILSKLKDERIPELLGVINEKSFYAFVIEWKPGLTLKDMIFRHKHKFSNDEIYNIGIKLLDIIKHLHENGIVHRDIRIPNVLIDNGEVYLIDFGLARFADKNQYSYNLDYSYFGDLLLYLIYSSFQKKDHKKLSWHEELKLIDNQRLFLKRLMGLDAVYERINDIETDFIAAFARAKDCI